MKIIPSLRGACIMIMDVLKHQ